MQLLQLETGKDTPAAGGGAGESAAVAAARWLLFPGWGEDERYWSAAAARLPASHSAHFVLLPGYGGNLRPVPLSLYSLMEAVEEAVMTLPEGPLCYAGNCSGAALALLAAEQLERPAARLVLVDCFAGMPPYFRLLLRGALGRICYLAAFANPLGRSITNRVLSHRRKTATDIMAAFAYSDEWINYRYLQLYGQLGQLEDHPAVQLADARVPDFIYGQRSFSQVRRALPRWRAKWPGLHTHELGGVGHLALQEAAEQIAQIMAAGQTEASSQ